VRVADVKFPLPYKPKSFDLVVVSDALDYLTPRYLNKTLPDLARVSNDGLVIFAGKLLVFGVVLSMCLCVQAHKFEL
jgi:putative pectin methylesterase